MQFPKEAHCVLFNPLTISEFSPFSLFILFKGFHEYFVHAIMEPALSNYKRNVNSVTSQQVNYPHLFNNLIYLIISRNFSFCLIWSTDPTNG